jgi:hypothetical protein
VEFAVAPSVLPVRLPLRLHPDIQEALLQQAIAYLAGAPKKKGDPLSGRPLGVEFPDCCLVFLYRPVGPDGSCGAADVAALTPLGVSVAVAHVQTVIVAFGEQGVVCRRIAPGLP